MIDSRRFATDFLSRFRRCTGPATSISAYALAGKSAGGSLQRLTRRREAKLGAGNNNNSDNCTTATLRHPMIDLQRRPVYVTDRALIGRAQCELTCERSAQLGPSLRSVGELNV